MGYLRGGDPVRASISLSSGSFQNFCDIRFDAASGGFGAIMDYCVIAKAGDDTQVRTAQRALSAYNKLSAEAGGWSAVGVDEYQESEGSSTLTVSFGVSFSPTNGVILTCNPTSSLTAPTIVLEYELRLFGDYTRVTPF